MRHWVNNAAMEDKNEIVSWTKKEEYRQNGDRLEPAQLRNFCDTAWLGKEMLCFPVLDSTNKKIKQLAAEGYPSGTVVTADMQTAGRGRLGRSWESLQGSGIFMTLLLRPDIFPDHASMLTLVAAMAVSTAIKNITGHSAQIKWPNDIVMKKKKICGILTEMEMHAGKIDYIAVGIGVNVNHQVFSDEICDMASSLYLVTGKYWSRMALIGAILEQFEKYYVVFRKTEDLSELMEEYNQNLISQNKNVRVLDPKEPFEGIARGINSFGELVVDTPQGTKLVSAGEVSVRGLYGYV